MIPEPPYMIECYGSRINETDNHWENHKDTLNAPDKLSIFFLKNIFFGMMCWYCLLCWYNSLFEKYNYRFWKPITTFHWRLRRTVSSTYLQSSISYHVFTNLPRTFGRRMATISTSPMTICCTCPGIIRKLHAPFNDASRNTTGTVSRDGTFAAADIRAFSCDW